jgi:hypothetical protein
MGNSNLYEAILMDKWRSAPAPEQVALINMADVWVRTRVPEAADLGNDLMIIMVQALLNLDTKDAEIIVNNAVAEAYDRKGRA